MCIERIPRVQACRRDSQVSDEATRTRELANAVRHALIEAGTRRRVSAGSRPRTGATVSWGPAAAAGARAPETGRRSARWRRWPTAGRRSRDAAEVGRGRSVGVRCWIVGRTEGTRRWNFVVSGSSRRCRRRAAPRWCRRRCCWCWCMEEQVLARCVVEGLEDGTCRRWHTPPATSDIIIIIIIIISNAIIVYIYSERHTTAPGQREQRWLETSLCKDNNNNNNNNNDIYTAHFSAYISGETVMKIPLVFAEISAKLWENASFRNVVETFKSS